LKNVGSLGTGLPKRCNQRRLEQPGERENPRMARFVKMATLDELPPGAAKEVEHEGRIYALFNVGGAVLAIDGICPHQGGPLAEGVVEGSVVTCPWHGWQFDLKSGTMPSGSRIKQTVFEVKVEGQDVLVAVA
jgi:nitrite reductase/ring-hydroxylating ferredoxin subunit